MNLLTLVLRNIKSFNEFSSGEKMNNLFFMDNLKLFDWSENELNSFVPTIIVVSDDIKMQSTIDNCAIMTLKRNKILISVVVELLDIK